MDGLYFALTLLCVMWLVAWHLWGDRTRDLWWPFDLRQDAPPPDTPAATTHETRPGVRPPAATSTPWRERARRSRR